MSRTASRSLTACLLAALLASCAHLRDSTGRDGGEADAAEARSLMLAAQLESHASSSAPQCPRLCGLAAEICALAARVCALSERDAADPTLAQLCTRGTQRCARARTLPPPACGCPAQ